MKFGASTSWWVNTDGSQATPAAHGKSPPAESSTDAVAMPGEEQTGADAKMSEEKAAVHMK